MSTAFLSIAIAILLFAGYVVAMNWGCVVVSMRNKRRGIDRHHSTVPVLSLILVAIAAAFYPRPGKTWMLTIPMADVGNWMLLWLPMALLRERRKRTITEPGAEPNERR